MFSTDVRQLLYGEYRILFILVEADDDGEDDTVRILHVRHGARQHIQDEREDEDSI
jgi:plasmid stabilization system protein ParE